MLLRAAQAPPESPRDPESPAVASAAPRSPQPFDLRRAALRRHTDTILIRAAFLAPDDRSLLYAVFRDHLPVAEIARAAGVSAPRLRARVRRLLCRLFSPRFNWALSARHTWPPERRRIAERALLQGLSQRAIAGRLQLSLPRVRAHLSALRALEEAALRAAPDFSQRQSST